jgi:hypothetical protein
VPLGSSDGAVVSLVEDCVGAGVLVFSAVDGGVEAGCCTKGGTHSGGVPEQIEV